jgi:UDP-glucose 4-epimerase
MARDIRFLKLSTLLKNKKLVPRRAGDPVAIVAGATRVREVLGWQPKYADLDFIVASALAWEKHLERRNSA